LSKVSEAVEEGVAEEGVAEEGVVEEEEQHNKQLRLLSTSILVAQDHKANEAERVVVVAAAEELQQL
jgi:hypothetical protein